jgi:hypothetical protein
MASIEMIRVEVFWKDARILDRLFEDELKDTKFLVDYHAMGYVIDDLPLCLVICQGVLPKADSNDTTMFRNVLAIPKAQIISLRILEPKQNPKPKPRVVSRVEIICL